MNLSAFLQFIHDNLTQLLAGMTIISFIINVIQYKTKKDVSHFFDSIYHICYRTIRRNEQVEKTNEELINTIFVIRTQAVAGLRSLGLKRSYGLYDQITREGIIYRFCRDTFTLIMKIKQKLPLIFSKTGST